MNAEQIATVPCPSCKGSGHLPIVHQTPGTFVPSPWLGKTRRCLSCKARGEVEAWRVCAGCGNWRDGCMCRPTVEIVKLERVRVEVTRAEATPVALPLGEPLPMPEQEAVSYPPPLTSADQGASGKSRRAISAADVPLGPIDMRPGRSG